MHCPARSTDFNHTLWAAAMAPLTQNLIELIWSTVFWKVKIFTGWTGQPDLQTSKPYRPCLYALGRVIAPHNPPPGTIQGLKKVIITVNK